MTWGWDRMRRTTPAVSSHERKWIWKWSWSDEGKIELVVLTWKTICFWQIQFMLTISLLPLLVVYITFSHVVCMGFSHAFLPQLNLFFSLLRYWHVILWWTREGKRLGIQLHFCVSCVSSWVVVLSLILLLSISLLRLLLLSHTSSDINEREN